MSPRPVLTEFESEPTEQLAVTAHASQDATGSEV